MSVSDQIRQVQEAAQSITASVVEIRGAITVKRAELEHARTATRPLPEVLAKFNKWVDDTAAHQAQQHGQSLVLYSFGAPSGHSGAGAPWVANTPVTWGFLALFYPDQAKESFAKLARSYTYTPGPPAVERAAVVAKLEGELAELETQEEGLIDTAVAVGVKLDHRAEVVARRAREREQQERVERAADAERRAADAAKEHDDWPAARASRSAYIHGRG